MATPTPTPRNIAVEVLCLWATTHHTIDALFQPAVARLPAIDRGLAKTLVYGVLRYKQYLDHVLRSFSRHPLRSMKPRTLMTLRVGIYQLLFLHRIPESAAVNATVNTLKEARQPRWLIGFVNGVLRAVARQRDQIPDAEKMSRAEPPILNHPDWLLERWRAEFGEERTRAICACNNSEPPLTLRVNTRAISPASLRKALKFSGIPVEPGLFSPQALRIDELPGAVSTLPGYREGHFQVQDEAAQLASLLAGPLPARCRVLDACAGLGGKTSHLAELLPPDGELIAVEPDRRRYSLLWDNLRRLHLVEQVVPERMTLDDFAAGSPQPFDLILVDAPCSGTGIIRRQPDIRWNRRPEDLAPLATTQLGLLDTAARLLKPGGVLLYATCSLEREENREVVERFLAAHPGYAVESAAGLLPLPAHKLVGASGFFQPVPTDGLDGFFTARLRAPAGL